MKRMTVRYCLLCALWMECMCFNVDGTERENVTFNCSHRNAYGNNKYFCKSTCTGKDILAKVASFGSIKSERIYLRESSGVLEVTFTNLKVSDEGVYWCGVERFGFDTYEEVILKVKEGTAPLQTTVVPTTPTTVSPTTWTYAPTTNATSSPEAPYNPPADAPLYAALCVGGIIILLVMVICVTKCRPQPQPQPVDQDDYDDIGQVLQPVGPVSANISRHHQSQEHNCRSSYVLATCGENTYTSDSSLKSANSSIPPSIINHHSDLAPPPVTPRDSTNNYENIPSPMAGAQSIHKSKIAGWNPKDLSPGGWFGLSHP